MNEIMNAVLLYSRFTILFSREGLKSGRRSDTEGARYDILFLILRTGTNNLGRRYVVLHKHGPRDQVHQVNMYPLIPSLKKCYSNHIGCVLLASSWLSLSHMPKITLIYMISGRHKQLKTRCHCLQKKLDG